MPAIVGLQAGIPACAGMTIQGSDSAVNSAIARVVDIFTGRLLLVLLPGVYLPV
jgi:hypothetical protein